MISDVLQQMEIVVVHLVRSGCYAGWLRQEYFGECDWSEAAWSEEDDLSWLARLGQYQQ